MPGPAESVDHLHHCREGCECGESRFRLSSAEVQAYARSIGIKGTVEVKRTSAKRLYSGRHRGYWARPEGATSHRIFVRGGMRAGYTCWVLRHELEHCKQAEQMTAEQFGSQPIQSRSAFYQTDAYRLDPLEVEADEAADNEWMDLGHCLTFLPERK